MKTKVSEVNPISAEGVFKKGWGREHIHFSNGEYCLKEMIFEKAGNHFSMHFHKDKHESWLVTRGSFVLTLIDTSTASVSNKSLALGDRWVNRTLLPHKLTALEDNSVMLEVSTADYVLDNHRVAPGMSQL